MYRKLLSALLLPIAPFYGAFLSYLIYHPPRKKHHLTPDKVGLPAEQSRIPLPGKGFLDIWLAGGSPDRIVVVGHGIGLSKSASLRHAKFLHDAGYTVCLFDHRNHGTSSQDRAFWGLGHRFTTDVSTVIRHLRSMPEYREARVAVYGFSFSTFPVSYTPMHRDCQVDAIICDSGPVLDIPPLFRGFLATKGIPVPAPMRQGPSLAVLGRVFARLGTAMLQAEWPPPPALYERIPVLFLTGAADAVVPSSGVAALAELFPIAEVHVLPDTPHLGGLKVQGEVYSAKVLDFLARAFALESGAPATGEQVTSNQVS